MNILTFDIEEWYIEKKFHGGHANRYKKYDDLLGQVLDLLDERRIKATFFCLGRIATDFPAVITRIADRGHEIGCHSNEHDWLTKLSATELRNDTRQAIDALEQVAGQKVLSYRAPAFSIGEQNKWALEILTECGIEHDASIFPAVRDFGGFASFQADEPIRVEIGNQSIYEYPIPVYAIGRRKIAYSGGGYFRLFPYWFISRQIKNSNYAMCYFHIGDLLHETNRMMTREEYETYFKQNGSFVNRLKRYAKSGIGSAAALGKMERLLREFDFVDIRAAVAFGKPGKEISL